MSKIKANGLLMMTIMMKKMTKMMKITLLTTATWAASSLSTAAMHAMPESNGQFTPTKAGMTITKYY